MTIARTFKTAFRALRRNPMRAFLTTLGIVIGIGSVIAMMEIGHGSSTAIKTNIQSMGANTLMVWPGSETRGGVNFGAGSMITMTPEDCEAIARECPAVRAAAPIVRARTQVLYGNKNAVPQIQGTNPDYLVIRDWNNLVEGAPFTEQDVRNASKVCLIGLTTARDLFGDESPVGKEVRVQNVAFKVVGVLSRKGANPWGQDQDDTLLAPWTTIKFRVSGQRQENVNQSAAPAASTSGQTNSLSKMYPSSGMQLYPPVSANSQMPIRFSNIDQIMASAVSADHLPAAVEQITQVLRERHRLADGEADDFQIRDQAEMTTMLSSTSGLMSRLLLFVALISLVVGGVGIMNIMLVSVTERTREIGLRMSVGARTRDILYQFLTESIVLCLAGGVAGILVGWGASWLVSAFLGWPTESTPVAVVAAVTVSAFVGLAFGFYPAWKASRLDPIEALRYE
jgi:ABC-type antimicrobial peptide transport system permease subunit